MSIAPSLWRSGRARAQYEIDEIPEDVRCPNCGGQGEKMAQRRFTGRWSLMPCNICWGTGRIDDDLEIMRPTDVLTADSES